MIIPDTIQPVLGFTVKKSIFEKGKQTAFEIHAFYGVPEEYKAETLSRMEEDMQSVYGSFLEVRS
ncbi:MAG: hypothetical protein K6G60_07535 [Lachnospiraceae bacterium]|nr:hypothetical protein [Lachnospiraceae bacterium]